MTAKGKWPEFFVREVKDKRMTKKGLEFLIGWSDCPLGKDDTWEPITNLTGSEHMICEFQKQHELDYTSKTAVGLKEVTDRRKFVNEKNTSTTLDNTVDDIQETRDNNGGDDARTLKEMVVLRNRGLTKETRGVPEFPGSSDHESIKSSSKNVREDLDLRWVTKLS